MRRTNMHRKQKYSSRVAESSSRYHHIRNNPVISTASSVYEYLSDYRDRDKEHFIALTLDGASRVINAHIISIGTLNQSLVHPREVFYPAIRERAAAIIIAHNHPSGQSSPSRADQEVTSRLRDAGRLLGIDIVDHIILTSGDYFSFSEEGLL